MWLVRLYDYELLKSHYENNQTKHEYQTILEHSDQAIVCHAEEHFLKFFNSKGQSIVEKSADLTEDKETLISQIRNIKTQISTYGQVKYQDSKALFQTALFKIYNIQDNSKEHDLINQTYSMDDILKISESELEKRVFVYSTC